MSKADRMFEKLGYIKCRDEKNIYYNKHYSNYDTKVIQFKEFICTVAVYIENSEGRMLGTDSITPREIKAIYQFYKENRWLDE